MKILPQGKRIVVEIEEMTETEAGIILTSNAHIIHEKGTVKEVGDMVSRVKQGDIILFKSWYLDSIELDKKTIHFLDEEGIMAVIK